MGFILTTYHCPGCGSESLPFTDTFAWKYQHETPQGEFCVYFYNQGVTR